jgi:LPXTG-motif cell wall-anchored protein
MIGKLQAFGKALALAGSASILAASLVAGSSASAVTALTNQWKFDEATAGSAAVDSVGGISGTAFGNPAPQPSTEVAYTSPSNPGSMQFDGQNYFEVANTLSADFTICAWIKTLSRGGDWHWIGANIIEAEVGGYGLDYGFGIDNEGKLMFGNGGEMNGGGNDNNVKGMTVVADDTWHEVCATRNNTTGEIILYVDGQQDASGLTGIGLLSANPVARIASGTDGAVPFVGLIDDLRLYTQILPGTEIASNFEMDEVLYQSGVDLANTGRDSLALLALGGTLLVIGAGSIALARRRSATSK